MFFKQLTIIFIVAIVAIVSSQSATQGPKVRVASGILQGIRRVSTNGRSFVSFFGVPYARPPIGKYRLREPQAAKPWPGVWNASRLLSPCLQYNSVFDDIIGSEDCLFVNIHTPKPKADALLPVVIFIHGGAFMYGAGGQYDGVHMMDRDLVVVTVNYRLGPLGFLSTGDDEIPGNAGLKDQSFALKWVRDNIINFGGNPDSITLTGCSAGSASVHYHYLSPLSRGTFHRGIAFSGSAFSSWAHAIKPLEKAKELASIVGCPTDNTRDMAECLKTRPGEVLVNAQVQMFDWTVNWFTIFVPTVEAPNVKNPFLTQYPYFASQAGAMQRVPLITSVVSEEGLYPAAAYQERPNILPELEARWEELASNIFEYNDTLPLNQRARVARNIKQEYLNGRPVGQATFDELVQALGDRLFVVGVGKLAQIHALRSLQPTYVYRFSYSWQYSFSNVMAKNLINYGVAHSDDVNLVLRYLPNETYRPKDIQMREALLDMIYSYASKGVPELPGCSEWSKVVPGQAGLNYLEIAGPRNTEMNCTANFGNKAFWDSLGFNENENYRGNRRD
ncbi:venom carboxylesterase-6-like [Maniola hyperantus]|uniref:venom carboxylesterase-6-like n=1 Tax=Aphantopus hyperantus TaxID=2795564 RepID=UPI001567CDC4|nr:venom carboxylesterase-6-like [Maniola hyperantus]